MKTSGQLAIVYRAATDLAQVRAECADAQRHPDRADQGVAAASSAGRTRRWSLATTCWPVMRRFEAATQMWAAGGRASATARWRARVPTVDLSHLSADERRAYILADNKLAENAGWDMDLLACELAGLRDNDFDLSVIGFGFGRTVQAAGSCTAGAAWWQWRRLAGRALHGPAVHSTLNARDTAWQDRKKTGWRWAYSRSWAATHRRTRRHPTSKGRTRRAIAAPHQHL
ncbi:hypothetical protein ACU4GD_28010 [Cupriavidus basilensis]